MKVSGLLGPSLLLCCGCAAAARPGPPQALLVAADAVGRRGGREGELQPDWQGLPVVHDPEPLELDYSVDGAVDYTNGGRWLAGRLEAARRADASSGDRPANPKNGTPWFRWKRVDSRGESSHKHFGGLRSTGDFDRDVLEAHNAVRLNAGLAPVNQSEGLTALASARVKKLANGGCYIRHSPTKDRWEKHGFMYVGENLYKVINMEPTGVDVVDAWYAEIRDYSYGPVGASCTKEQCAGRAEPPCMLGHFTQVMWASTTHIGCAREECPGQEKKTFVVVCNYGPGGNIAGRLPFPGHRALALGLATEPCFPNRGGAVQAQQLRSGAAGPAGRSGPALHAALLGAATWLALSRAC